MTEPRLSIHGDNPSADKDHGVGLLPVPPQGQWTETWIIALALLSATISTASGDLLSLWPSWSPVGSRRFVLVLVIYCRITYDPRKTRWLKATALTILKLLRVRNWSKLIWVLWLRVSHRLQSSCPPGRSHSQGSSGEGSPSKLAPVVVGRVQFLLAGQLTTWRLASLVWAGEREQENTRKMEVTVFPNPVTEGTSHHFLHILFFSSKSLGVAHTQGRAWHRVWIPVGRNL